MGRLGFLTLSLLLVVLLALAAPVRAAEVLQVRSATLLQVGDRNRSYRVELACLDLPLSQQDAATDWLRQQLPRRTRVNLRPLSALDGTLVAQVQRLDRGTDLSSDLIAAGFGSAPVGCGP
jgi:hypothetical protein